MSNRLQLRERVRGYLDEPVAAFWTDAELNNWINQGYFFYYQWVVMSFDGYFAEETNLNIVANQALYPMPANFYKIRLLERIFSTFTVPLRVFDRMESANMTSNTNFSNLYLPTYRFEGSSVVLEPTPGLSITNGLRLEYVPQPVQMNLDSDSPDPDFLVMWEETIVLRAAIAAKMKEESVVNQGTDVGTLQSLLGQWEQNIKESIEVRTEGRRYTEPYGMDEGSYYYYP